MKRLRSFLSRRRSQGPQAQQQSLQQFPPPSQQQGGEDLRQSAPQQPLQSSPPAQPDVINDQPQPESARAVQHQHNQASEDQALLNVQATAGTLNIALRNDTTSPTVYAYITGLALDRGNSLFLLQADARTPYYPGSPSAILQPLQVNCAIPLGAPGHTVIAQIPHIAGGRIWFSINQPLVFRLNPGPALVEPSVTNSSDPNANIDWAFAEFTFNSDQLYANISYVDFVSVPVALTLQTVNSGTQHVSGFGPGGLQQIANGLVAQHNLDHQGWDRLIVRHSNGTPLRILSPNQGMVMDPSLFQNYYNPYVDQVLAKYARDSLTLNTQAGFGVIHSTPSAAHTLTFGTQSFIRPSTHDIFSCSTGPFATGSDAARNAIIPRLAAAFNRSTLLSSTSIPAPPNLYYKNAITNHYSRIVHSVNLDGKGYAFPYDDVQADGEPDQSGKVQAGDPKLWTVAVGGAGATRT